MVETSAGRDGEGAGAASPDYSKRDVARGMGAFAIMQVTVRLVGLGVVVVVARLLSNEDFGRYSVALALSSMLTLIVELGMGGYLVREGTQFPARMGTVLGHVLSIQLVTGVLAVAICAVVALLLDYDRETFVATIVLAIGSVGMIVQRSLMAVLVSLKRFRSYAGFQSAQALVQAALTLVAAVAGAGPAGIAAAVLVTAVISFPAAHLLLRRHWSQRLTFTREGLWQTFGVGVAYSAAKFGNILLTYIDAVMVQAIRGNGAAAQYGAAYRLLLALKMFPQIYGDALSQPAAKLARSDRPALAHVFNRAASQLFIIGIPLAVGGFILGEPIMSAVFGERYAAAGTTASLLFLTLALSYPVQMVTITSLAMGLERRVALSYGLTLVVNVTANAMLIPAYGPAGAAAAMLVSTLLLAGLTIGQLAGAGLRPVVGRRYLKAAVAGAAMSGVVLLTGGLPLPVTVLAGAATYAAGLVALKTLEPEDLDMLPGGSRLGWLVR